MAFVEVAILMVLVDIASAKTSPSIAGHTELALMIRDLVITRRQDIRIMPHSKTSWGAALVFAIDGNHCLPMGTISLI